jgi:uncharacterized protein (TIGR00299 family) protein
MGIAGDMLSSALLGLFDDKEKCLERLNSMKVPKVTFKLERAEKCGIMGDHLEVLIDGSEEESFDVTDTVTLNESKADDHHLRHEQHGHLHEYHDHHDEHHDHHDDHHDHYDHHHDHHGHSLYDIEDIIESLDVPKEVRSDIREVYELLAEAESKVHGVAVSEIHFHEVGNLDAVADIAAACYLMHELDPDKVIVSPINVGSGQVKCAHGILPVPTPAAALLLTDIPSYSSDCIKGELCTPTGAALVKYFAFEFGPQPVMAVNKIGYGMGKKDFEQANCVRAILGTANEDADRVVELSCNVDDMTSEEIGFATEMLMEAGALEVYTIPIGMKKNRPGFIITCMCREDRKESLTKEIFKHTTTIGIRESTSSRYILSRETVKSDTPYGEVRIKKSSGFDVHRSKIEYDDLAGIARRTGKSLLSLKKELADLMKDEIDH